ncbi:MAG: J domain-containing protein [Rhodocyclales bacterium]|nr:J domain-containing protein [Rhodocyclales bacterium]
MPHEAELPAQPMACIAALVALALADGHELLILVPDDALLPELSNALDLAIRPLCLVLPHADFAVGIALRATLSLLKSRLWRDGEDSHTPSWTALRRRLDAMPGPWREAQAWIAPPGDDHSVRIDFAAVFPALILPVAAWTTASARPDAITLLYRCDAPADLNADVAKLLRLGIPIAPSRSRKLALTEETARLLLERTRLTQDIADLELELASVQGELAEFMRDYYRRVGSLMTTLDALQAGVAARKAAHAPNDPGLQAEAAASRDQAEESASDAGRFTEALAPDAPAFNPDSETKQMFRRLAQQIHPDRAIDADDRAWRTRLMSEANRAYRNGDTASLREIASLWQEQAANRRGGGDPGASLLHAQLQCLRARLSRIESELHRLFGSPLYELFIAARQARRQNRDLLGEMAARLESTIMELRQAAQ